MFFNSLKNQDFEVSKAISKELNRQQNQIEMIASENFTSIPVMQATGSVMTNKYAEGYPGRRYYGGCEYVDIVENLAQERLCKLFNCKYANVQPHSGAQANQAILLAFLKPGDNILGMSLDGGGHLTHGSKVNMSGKWFNSFGYGVREKDGRIDYEEVSSLAKKHMPKLIIAGGSAYPRVIDFKKFREIADEVGALLMVDMAHFAGLVAGDAFPSPFPYAHIVTSTTHKTLRGPRGGIIMTNDLDYYKKINSAVFPGNQGGPLMHVIAAKAVSFGEALKPDFKKYAKQVVINAKALSDTLIERGLNVVSGGTDSHLILVDLSDFNFTGKDAESALERAGITCNKNSIANDKRKPMETSGIRLGSPAATTRGLKEEDFIKLGEWISDVLESLEKGCLGKVENKIREKIEELCLKYPLYPDLN